MRKHSQLPDVITGLIHDITKDIASKNKINELNNLWNGLANTVPALLFIKDADDDYRYLYANRNLEVLFNKTNKEIIGHNVREFVSKDDADRIYKDDVSLMNSDKSGECYELLCDANGIEHKFHSIKIPSVNEFGHRILIQMTTDVTELQELSEVRKIVSNAFETLFSSDNLKEGIRGILKSICEFVGFTRGFVCYVDHQNSLVRMFTTYVPDSEIPIFDSEKYKTEDVTNEAWFKEIIDSKRGKVYDFDFSNIYDREKASIFFPRVYELRDKFDVRRTYVQCLEVNSEPWGYIGYITQYSEPKKLSDNEKNLLNVAANIIELAITRNKSRKNLQVALKEANEAAKVKSNFLSIMSHEIRTPLNAVLGFTSLLRDKHLDEKTRKEYLDNITVSGNTLLELINDILDLSKLSAKRMSFEPIASSLLDIISQIGILFRSKCVSKGLRFIGSVPKNSPSVWVDAKRIRQILINLVGNAVKFTDKGSITVSSEFKKVNDKVGTVIIKVKDTGIGIPEENKTDIFEPFVQAKNVRGTVTENKGTGLGLAICKTMAECMDGELSMESSLGNGTTFILTLKNVKFLEYNSTSEHKLSKAELLDYGDFSQYSVLVVDDVQMNLMVMKAMLKKLKISATTVMSANEALAIMQDRHFDFILTDLWMPELNGAELAQRLRRELKGEMPPIAVVTADVDAEKHFDFSVFDAVLIKPITPYSIKCFFDEKKH